MSLTARAEGSLASGLRKFTSIKLFVLQVRSASTVHLSDASSKKLDMERAAEMGKLCRDIMHECQTLQRVEIGADLVCEWTSIAMRTYLGADILFRE
jgi:hypothetical protein